MKRANSFRFEVTAAVCRDTRHRVQTGALVSGRVRVGFLIYDTHGPHVNATTARRGRAARYAATRNYSPRGPRLPVLSVHGAFYLQTLASGLGLAAAEPAVEHQWEHVESVLAYSGPTNGQPPAVQAARRGTARPRTTSPVTGIVFAQPDRVLAVGGGVGFI